MHHPIRVESLEDHAKRYNVWANCENTECLHHVKLDMPVLIGRFGPNFPLADIKTFLKCTECGSSDTSLTLTTLD